MKLRNILANIANIVADEAEQNEQFRERLEHALGSPKAERDSNPYQSSSEVNGRRGGRRTPAVLDPIEIAVVGESSLRSRLHDLSLDQLRDVVAQYRMDPGKLVMKWKDPHRVIDRIVEMSLARAAKGDAFRAV